MIFVLMSSLYLLFLLSFKLLYNYLFYVSVYVCVRVPTRFISLEIKSA